MPARRSNRAIALCVVATLGLLALDLGTKEWAVETLSEERRGAPPPVCAGRGLQRLHRPPIVVVEGYLEMQYAENCGAAFGLLDDGGMFSRVVFAIAALGATVALMWMFVVGKGFRLFPYSVPLVVSGAVGNLVDRVSQGYVVDFIRFHVYDKFEYPTFNVADITIVVGVGLLLLDGWGKDAKGAEAAKKAEASAPKEASAAPKKRRKKKKAGTKPRASDEP